MEQTDSTVIATALPAIAADIGASPIALKLALTSYLVALAIFIPVSGWMADRFGAKRVFLAAICVFMASSVACSQAGSLEAFVVARFVQGMGGALMTPIARLVVVRMTPKRELVPAMAWLTIPALVGPLIGPPLGGFITTYASWHWIFLINVPIGLVGIAATLLYLPQIEGHEPQPMDWKGFFLAGFAAAGVIFGLSVVSLPALPVWTGMLMALAGLLAALLYIRHARRTPRAILPLSLMSEPGFRASITGGSIFRIGIGAVPFLMPLMLQLGFGFDPFESGMITFTGAIGAMAMKFAAAAIYNRFGFRNVLILMALVSSVLVGATAFIFPDTPIALLYALLLAGGFSRSLFFTGVNALAYAEVDSRQAAQATAFNAVMQQASLAMGVAYAGAMLEASLFVRGGALGIADFHAAFIAVALVMAAGAIPFVRLHPEAGASALSKRGPAGEAGPAQ